MSAPNSSLFPNRSLGDVPLYTLNDVSSILKVPISSVCHAIGFRAKRSGIVNDNVFLSFRKLVAIHLSSVYEHATRRRRRSAHVDRALYAHEAGFRPLYSPEVSANEIGYNVDLKAESHGLPPNDAKDLLTSGSILLLSRVKNKNGEPIAFYPFSTSQIANPIPYPISVSPGVCFGKPVLSGTNIRTECIIERFLAGDTVNELAQDYEVSPETIEGAIRYESLPLTGNWINLPDAEDYR